MHATTIAVDLAKTVFEVAIANQAWRVVARHRFTQASRPLALHRVRDQWMATRTARINAIRVFSESTAWRSPRGRAPPSRRSLRC